MQEWPQARILILECTSEGGGWRVEELRVGLSEPGFRRESRWTCSADIRSSSSGRFVREYQTGETLHGLAKRHGISRNLVRIWAANAEAGEFDDAAAASILQEYEARIGALKRLIDITYIAIAFGFAYLRSPGLPRRARKARPRGSMGRRGNPYDNAKAESPMKTLKVEYDTFEDATASLPRFIDEAHNRKRLHSALVCRSPNNFEQQHARQAVNPKPDPVHSRGCTPPYGSARHEAYAALALLR
jgi:transposase InsO family protein